MSSTSIPRVSMEFTFESEELLRLLQVSNYTQVDHIETFRDEHGVVQRMSITVSREHDEQV